jgi:hypothetical protein
MEPTNATAIWGNPSVYLLGLIVSFVVIATLRKLFSKRPSVNEAITIIAEAKEKEMRNLNSNSNSNETSQPCVCGQPATEPAPGIQRGRGGVNWLRNYFGMPPRWKRIVDSSQPPAFCASHAGVADEMVNQGLLDLRAKYAALNVDSSIFIAGFEQEHLLAKVKDSLTENQKKEQRARAAAAIKPNNVREMRQRTGTDEETSN